MEIKESAQQKTLMIRTITPVGRLSEVMGEAYHEIADFMAREGVECIAPPYAMYYNMDTEALDVEMGFPVRQSREEEGRIRPGMIPGGRIATMIHTGPYSRLEESYTKLMVFVKEKGLEIAERMYEYYLNDPAKTSPENLQTRICLILKES